MIQEFHRVNCELCVHKGKYLDSHVKARKPHICICEMLNVIAFLGKRHSGMRELCCFVALGRKRLSNYHVVANLYFKVRGEQTRNWNWAACCWFYQWISHCGYVLSVSFVEVPKFLHAIYSSLTQQIHICSDWWKGHWDFWFHGFGFFKSVIWFWLIFFAVLDDFFHGFAVSNRSQYPLLLSRFLSMAAFIIRHFKNTSWIPRSAFTGYCIQLHYKLFLLAFVHLLTFFFS